MSWLNPVHGDPLSWLLEPKDPGVRYLAMRHLVGLPPDDPELIEARALAYSQGPIAAVLNGMTEVGTQSKPDAGYNPKYFSTQWAVILLAQLGDSAAQD